MAPNELYDLARDPDERTNLSADPQQQARIATLRARLDARSSSNSPIQPPTVRASASPDAASSVCTPAEGDGADVFPADPIAPLAVPPRAPVETGTAAGSMDLVDAMAAPALPMRRPEGLLRRAFRPSVLVGALSLLTIIGMYWFMATRPGVNPALVPPPPTILRRSARSSAAATCGSTPRRA